MNEAVTHLSSPEEIAAAKHDSERSPEWPRVRAQYLGEHPACAACGREHDPKAMEVHHRQPFHLDPAKELDLANLITLCQHESCNCHLVFGHLLNYKAFNPDVDGDAASYLEKLQHRPMALGEATGEPAT